MKGKMIHFGQPYGCSPEDLRELHLRLAWYFLGAAKTLLFRASAHAQLKGLNNRSPNS